ncbi:MAG: preprotein translocase subunit SecG [Fimbriimonadales bacterium]|nr:preprotein translocase subunit SecG [Fimbriimonadales bacterium]
MATLISILNIVLLILCAVFVGITVIFGSKSDAMSGGSSQIRTTFKGKAGFDDHMSKLTLYLGVSFMALALLLDILHARMG